MPPRRTALRRAPKRRRTAEQPDPEAVAEADATGITDSADWTEGDFELISSDNVRFRVPTYHLQSSSVVFRDMIGDGDSEKRVHFTDAIIERSTVLGDFFDFIIKADLILDCDDSPRIVEEPLFQRAVNLLKFLIKYDCRLARRTFLQSLWGDMVQRVMTPRYAFTLGVIAAPSDIVTKCRWEWGRVVFCEAIDCVNQHLRGELIHRCYDQNEYSLEPSRFGIEAWSLIPPAYQWALCKLNAHPALGKARDLDVVGVFEDYVTEAERHERKQALEAARYN